MFKKNKLTQVLSNFIKALNQCCAVDGGIVASPFVVIFGVFFVVPFLVAPSLKANGIQWAGKYTVEGVTIENPLLDGSKKSQSYGLHHLVLRPEIIPADGFIIRSRFDIFNSKQFPNSQVGAFWGGGAGSGVGSGTTIDTSNTLAHTLAGEQLAINELYVTWVQEFGSLVIGRAPLQFGLGASYSAGLGEFDHWFDNRDMIAYKMEMGNLFLMPMIAKVQGGEISSEDDVTDYIFHFEYANKDTDLALGVMYRVRRSGSKGNDTPANLTAPTGVSASGVSGFSEDQTSVFMRQYVGPIKLGVEASFLSGNMGITSASGSKVKQNGFAIALELDKVRGSDPFDLGIKAGLASGDDPTTEDRYEGFLFNRNYDVAFLMFNHFLGADGLDALHTNALRNTALPNSKINSIDNEAISNVLYFAPHYKYHFSEKYALGAKFATGVLQRAPTAAGGKKDLGYELDIGFQLKPNERVTWWTEVGLLSPGGAFSGSPTDNFKHNFTYGVTTKAAISF